MQIECDLSVPAFYVRFTEREKVHHSVEEECALSVDPNDELVGISVGLAGILEEFPRSSIEHIVQNCVRDGWRLQSPTGGQHPNASVASGQAPVVFMEFREPDARGRKVVGYCVVDVNPEGVILGLECLLTGNPDGPVRFEWLCQKRL